MLLSIGKAWVWWQQGNVLAFNNVDGGKLFPIWDMSSQICNSVCIISRLSERFYKINVNGENVYKQNV